MANRVHTDHRPIWTPKRRGEPRVAQHTRKAEGWGPSGMWNAGERLRVLGPLPAGDDPLTCSAFDANKKAGPVAILQAT